MARQQKEENHWLLEGVGGSAQKRATQLAYNKAKNIPCIEPPPSLGSFPLMANADDLMSGSVRCPICPRQSPPTPGPPAKPTNKRTPAKPEKTKTSMLTPSAQGMQDSALIDTLLGQLVNRSESIKKTQETLMLPSCSAKPKVSSRQMQELWN
jgi:uncharacterized Zn finger protein (UPF0148 family)